VNYEIKIRQERRNNLVMRVSPGALEVLIPNWMERDNPQVIQFVEKGISRFGGKIPPRITEQISRHEIERLVAVWAEKLGVQPRRVQMRTMHSKWGSCSRCGTITLDKALCWLPVDLVEYVICHELAHLLEFDHGAGFRALMSQHMPDWEARKQALTSTELN
jgi:predicted metal-dependent hydrolase